MYIKQVLPPYMTARIRGVGLANSPRVLRATSLGAYPISRRRSLRGLGDATSDATAYVTSLYQTFLGRAPEAAGLAYWVDKIVSGANTNAEVANLIQNSPEAQSKPGAATVFVTQLYQQYLGRQPEAADLNYWTGQITSGAMTQDQVSYAIRNSAEAVARLAANTTTSPVTGTTPATSSIFSSLSTPITLPLLGAVPAWEVGLAVLAIGYVFMSSGGGSAPRRR